MQSNAINRQKQITTREKCENCGKKSLSVLSKYVKRFLSETTLQGLIYVGNSRLSIVERVYFLIWFIAVVSVAINFATNVYERWDTMPVIVGIKPHSTSVRTTPFPAITICNMNQALRSKVQHYPFYSLGYGMTQKICFQDFDYSVYDDLEPASKDATFSNFIWQSGQTCDNMIVYCRYGNDEARCTDFFREVLMDEGICCSFNVLHPSYLYKGEYIFVRDFTSSVGTIPVDWNLETGYAQNLPLYYYPRIAQGAGVSLGFTFVLNANLSEYICSSTFSTGLKVITHNPIDTPHVKETGMSVMPGYQYYFHMHINSWEALPSTRSITPRRRQCLFNNELKLHYFRYYTRRNCEMECDSQYMLRRCNCIPYYMPLIYPNASVCHVRDFNCENIAEAEVNDKEHLECKSRCLPGCFNMEYLPEVHRTPFAKTTFGLFDGFFSNLSRELIHENLALVHVFFVDDLFRSKVRSPYTSFTDYLSQTGGIMSLMMGFSVISFAEVTYFFLIRPTFDLLFSRPVLGWAKSDATQEANINRAIVTVQPKLSKRRSLAISRQKDLPYHSFTSQKIYNGLMKKLPIRRNSSTDLYVLEEEGLFPYTE